MNAAEAIPLTNTEGYLKTIQHHVYFRDAQALCQFVSDPALKSSMSAQEWAEFINMPINTDGDTLLIWACYRSYDALVHFLINEPAINLVKTDFHGFDAITVSHHAKRFDLATRIKDKLEAIQQDIPPSPFEFDEYEAPITTPSSAIKEWLYGGKKSSNQNEKSLSAKRLSA